MGKYSKYPEYKDSGVEWVKRLPVHWETVHLRWVSIIYAGGTPSKTNISYWENGEIPWLNSGAVNQGWITSPSAYITKSALENSSAKWIPRHALVVALAGQGKTKGMVAQLGISTTCNQSMAAIVPNDINYSRYLFWWLNNNYQNIRNMSGGDLRDGLNLEHLGDIHCPLPTIRECELISQFLDYETAKIDTLIEKQQQLIELLKEKRQAVISHVVTKGLDPNVPMKDSGVEWLGEVPEHWDVIKFNYAIKMIGDIDHYMPSSIDSGIPYVMTGDLQELVSKINFDKCKQVGYSDYVKLSRKIKASKGDVILARYATIGTVSYVDIDIEFLVSYSCVTIKPDIKKISGKYLFNYLKSKAFFQSIKMHINSNTQGNVGVDSLKNIEIVVPPLSEQQEIICFLHKEIVKNDYLIQKAEQQISLMQERRTALISAAVTGKIDVRNWQAPNHEAQKELCA